MQWEKENCLLSKMSTFRKAVSACREGQNINKMKFSKNVHLTLSMYSITLLLLLLLLLDVYKRQVIVTTAKKKKCKLIK